jgi:hypothetical protein
MSRASTPVEIQLAQTLAAGKPVTGVTMDDVHMMNASHATEYETVTKEATLDLLRHNSAAASAAVSEDLEALTAAVANANRQ